MTQWCLAALATVETPLAEIQMIDGFGAGQDDPRRAGLVQWAERVLSGLERRLDGRDWIASDDFTVADILTASVLREVRHTDLLAGFPRLTDYYARAMARPAWKRALALYADWLGVEVADIE
ncbi:MAG TPA: glutathione binding-like protein [Caulobacteraceae bacterium]